MIFITEAWLDSSCNDSLLINNCAYSVIRHDRVSSSGGGVCVIYDNLLCCTQVVLPPKYFHLEFICIDVNVKGDVQRFILCYNPPSYTAESMADLCACLAILCDVDYVCTLVGDFNLPMVNWFNLPMVNWFNLPMVNWFNLPMVNWFNLPMVNWFNLPMVNWFNLPMVNWFNLPMVNWFNLPMVNWFNLPMVNWFNLPMVNWFNLPMVNWLDLSVQTAKCADFLNFVIDHGFSQLVCEPTRGLNILDLILCNDSSAVIDLQYLNPFSTSDHLCLSWLSWFASAPSGAVADDSRNCDSVQLDFRAAEFDNLNIFLSTVDWVHVFASYHPLDVDVCGVHLLLYYLMPSICMSLLRKTRALKIFNVCIRDTFVML